MSSGEPHYEYQQTINLLETFKDILNPFSNLWSYYSTDNYDMDFNYCLNLALSDLEWIKALLEQSLDKENSLDDIKDISDRCIRKLTNIHENKATKQRYDFRTDTVALHSGLFIVPENLVKDIEEENEAHEDMVERIMQKYAIKKIIAEKWLKEYYIFMILLIESQEHTLPSSVIEQVWHTHTEFYKHYIRFCDRFFGRTMYIEDYVIDVSNLTNQMRNYKTTLKDYLLITGVEPDAKIWEPAEIKFQHREEIIEALDSHAEKPSLCGDRVFVNIFRLCSMTYFEKLDGDKFKLSKISKLYTSDPISEDSQKKTLFHRSARQEAIRDNQLYLWRETYPNCSHLYNRYEIYLDEQQYYNDMYKNSTKTPDIFYNGNFAFVSNPYDIELYDSGNIIKDMILGMYKNVKKSKILELEPDDMADGFLYRFEYIQKR